MISIDHSHSNILVQYVVAKKKKKKRDSSAVRLKNCRKKGYMNQMDVELASPYNYESLLCI